MSIVYASCMEHSDLSLLGNNLLPSEGKRRRIRRRTADLRAVNRSLAVFEERIERLDPRRVQSGPASSARARCCA